MAVTETTLFTGFDRILNKVIIQDTTDYAAQGIDFGAGDTVEGFLKFEYDIGQGWVVVYNNLVGVTPDMTPPSVIDFSTIDIPLGTDGKPLKAAYQITYLVHVVQGAAEYDNTDVFNYNYAFVDPEICVSTAVDCSSSKITSIDVTDYTVAGTTIESTQRAHTLYPPPTVGLNPLTGDLVTLVYVPISNGTWTAELISNISYVQPDGLHIVVRLESSKEFLVSCQTKLSKVLCCITTIYNNYQALLTKNPTKAENYLVMTVRPTWDALVLFLAAQSSGNTNKMALAYADVLEYSGCGDCACDDELAIIQPENIGGLGFSYQVDSPNGTVAVTQSVAGSVITFHLEVSASILNIINNIASLVNVAGDGAYITVAVSGSNPTTYTVSYTGPVIHTNQLVQKQIKINPYDPLSLDPNYMVLEVVEIYNGGANVATPPHTYKLGLNSPNGVNDYAIIQIAGFLNNLALKSFIANASINRRWDAPGSVYTAYSNLRCEVFHTDVNSLLGNVLLRIVDSQNNLVDLAKLNSMMFNNSMYISLDIIIES